MINYQAFRRTDWFENEIYKLIKEFDSTTSETFNVPRTPKNALRNAVAYLIDYLEYYVGLGKRHTALPIQPKNLQLRTYSKRVRKNGTEEQRGNGTKKAKKMSHYLALVERAGGGVVEEMLVEGEGSESEADVLNGFRKRVREAVSEWEREIQEGQQEQEDDAYEEREEELTEKGEEQTEDEQTEEEQTEEEHVEEHVEEKEEERQEEVENDLVGEKEGEKNKKRKRKSKQKKLVIEEGISIEARIKALEEALEDAKENLDMAIDRLEDLW